MKKFESTYRTSENNNTQHKKFKTKNKKRFFNQKRVSKLLSKVEKQILTESLVC